MDDPLWRRVCSFYGDPDLSSTVVSQENGAVWQSSQVFVTFPPDANAVRFGVAADALVKCGS